MRLPPVPSNLTGPLATYLKQVVRQLNGEAYISKFSGTNPNSSSITGIPGDLVVNIRSASDSSRLWSKSGATVASSRTGWVQHGLGGTAAASVDTDYRTITFQAGQATNTWTDMPAILTAFDGSDRYEMAANLISHTSVRLMVFVSAQGASTASIRAQYSLDAGSSWTQLNDGVGPEVSIAAGGLKVSSWYTLATSARTDVWLRPIGIGGDGVVDPVFGNIHLEVR